MDEAEYCNRISMMVDGKIEALDTPQPVSYTHLDVYKRQTLDIYNHIISSSYFGIRFIATVCAAFMVNGCLLYTSRCV